MTDTPTDPTQVPGLPEDLVDDELDDPEVPGELLCLAVDLDLAQVTPDDFAAAVADGLVDLT